MTATKVKGRKPAKPPAGPPELPPHLFELRDEELLAALEVESDGDRIGTVRVGGSAVIVGSGEIRA